MNSLCERSELNTSKLDIFDMIFFEMGKKNLKREKL